MILRADAARIPLRDGAVHMVVTSPPYWGLRSYPAPPLIWGGEPACAHRAVDSGAFCACGAWRGQLGLEPVPELYVEHLVDVFREVWRVLRDDGTLWLNLGDSYITAPHGNGATADPKWPGGRDRAADMVNRAGPRIGQRSSFRRDRRPREDEPHRPAPGLKSKDMVGIPWRVAFALQTDGWTLRSDIVWSKPNPMPESVTDRPTKAHEYLFLLAKRERYYYDAEAIKEPAKPESEERYRYAFSGAPEGRKDPNGHERIVPEGMREFTSTRNRRTVWEIPTQPYPEAHFATFPEDLVVPCILAGTSERGCCVACGAPWRRVTEQVSVERGLEYTGKHAASDEYAAGRRMLGAAAAGRAAGLPHDNPIPPTVTIGWGPGCDCAGGGSGTPGFTRPLVLDPFAGSGTVGEVCHRLGRRFVGLELAEAYVALANRRAAQLGLL